MLLIYNGPDGQVNHDVGLALAARSEPKTVTLQGVARDVVGTDDPGASAILEPGKSYDLPAELAERLLASSDDWSRVANYDAMTKAQLLDIAAERDIDGRSTMSQKELANAIRKSSAPATSDASAAPIGSDPGGVPRDDTGAPLDTTTQEVTA